MMKIYFAGPLFSEAERNFNSDLTNQLENTGFHVFLPQRDGVETNKPPYDKMSREERRKTMFELDRDKILESDIFLFVLDGRIPDEGACVELGMAYTEKIMTGRRRFIIGLHTDIRAAFIKSKLNPMLTLCFDQLVDTREALFQSLEKWFATQTEQNN
ncbi:MAG: nucleoside 2-deoxyribosyltransferase domain-containing protein [Desulfobacterium sp.]|nr:nucleoside 2-deoxyribosyltransferase domain-containing protein [Desulfobacterium sp.]